MMHVAALMPFTPPADAPANYLRQMFEDTRGLEVVAPWNLKLSHPRMLRRPDQSWVVDDKFDIDYHVRRSALASPGDERELGILVSRLHSQNIDFTRPPWELHFIEGLEDGRFAIYMKIHHSLVDGYTGNKILERSMSTDPSLRDQPLFFNVGPPSKTRSEAPKASRNPIVSLLGGAVGGAQSLLNVGKALYNTQIRSDDEYGDIANSFQAPHSILNKHISRNRRFATQVYSFDRLKSIGAKHGATVNDVALAIIGGGLRAFLDQLGELPAKPLIAFLPVNIRPKDDVGGGNAVGTILATMGTDIEDPVDRLKAITASTKAAKRQLQDMSQTEVLAYTAGADGADGAAARQRHDRRQGTVAVHVQLVRQQCSRTTRDVVSQRKPAGGHVPGVHSDAWDGTEHHAGELRRHDELRIHRMPRCPATSATSRGVHRRCARRAGQAGLTGCRSSRGRSTCRPGTSGGDDWYAAQPPLRETFHVFTDEDGVLRTDHWLRLGRWQALALHYRLERD